jgi:class 3 adenylate cyclase
MEVPDTHYVETVDGVYIAYQVLGEGEIDIVFAGPFISNVDTAWELGGWGELFRGIAALGRLIIFDRRGSGLSDRPNEPGSLALEVGMNDLRAVLDATGSERPVLFGFEDGAMLAAMFAASNPDRASALIMFSAWAKGQRSPDYPWAWSPEEGETWVTRVKADWGTEDFVRALLSEDADDNRLDANFVRGFARYIRSCASPGAVLALDRMHQQIDARPILRTLSVPTLSLKRADDPERSREEAEYITSLIPGARLVELAGKEHRPFLGDVNEIVRAVGEFVHEVRTEEADFDRFLASVLFTDVVQSTSRAAELGDQRWRELLERHHAIVRAMLVRYRGTEVGTAGDGFFSTFDGPARAVRCAEQIVRSLEPTGLEIRAGVHTGEVQIIDGKIGGLGVVIGARIGSLAGPSEILVSQTVKDLVAGSGLMFEDAAEHDLKGVPDRWRLYRVID